MTELNNLTIPKFDPNTSILTASRPVQGIVKARAVSLDADFDEYARWLYVGVTGAISYVGWDGTTVVIPSLSAGVFHPIYAKRINTSGTTATNIFWGN